MIRNTLLTLTFAFSATAAYAFPLPRMEKGKVKLPPTLTTNYDFEGIVALDDCSGSIVRFENSKDSDPAMVLTNGHCYEDGFMDPGTFINNVSSNRRFTILKPNGDEMGTISASKVIYASMTKTDITPLCRSSARPCRRIAVQHFCRPDMKSDRLTLIHG